MQLEELKSGARINGILPNTAVTVVAVRWIGSTAVELTYKDPNGRVANQLLYRDDEPSLELVAAIDFHILNCKIDTALGQRTSLI